MSCTMFQKCLDELTWSESKAVDKNKSGNKKETNGRVFDGYPCHDMSHLQRCVAYADGRSRMSCSENGKTYMLDKKRHIFDVICMHVDGGIIDKTDSRDRCDYAFFLNDGCDGGKGRAIFIELKGGNMKKALSQLFHTLKMNTFEEVHKKYKRIYCRIVNTSSVPRIQNTKEFMDLKKLLLMYNGNLKTGEKMFMESYEDLDKR